MDEQASVGGTLLPNLGVDGAQLNVALETPETRLSKKHYCACRGAYRIFDLFKDVAECSQVFTCHPKYDIVIF